MRNPYLCIILFIFLITDLYSNAQNHNFSHVPGVVIGYRQVSTGIFLGTPSIVITPDGKYVSSHNEFGKNTNLTFVFESRDKGKTWSQIAKFKGIQYGLFILDNALYAMGVDKGYGNIVIRRSMDFGYTWTEPYGIKTGLLRTRDIEKGYGTSAVSVVIDKGRIWRPMETGRDDGKWGNFEVFMMSAPIDSDLLDAQNWKTSVRMAVDPGWGIKYGTWLEGGAVKSKTGEILNVLRVDNRSEETAAIIRVVENGERLTFSPEKDFIHFPGGCKKFVIRFDEISNLYWSLSNWIPEKYKGHNVERTRNTLALISSPDLRTWTVNHVVLQDENVDKSGFQYADWLVEEEDIVFVSRTAYFDGINYADNQHNSNFITFHRITNFRKYTSTQLERIEN